MNQAQTAPKDLFVTDVFALIPIDAAMARKSLEKNAANLVCAVRQAKFVTDVSVWAATAV